MNNVLLDKGIITPSGEISKDTRIEMGESWYLVGIRAEDLNGLRVRI